MTREDVIARLRPPRRKPTLERLVRHHGGNPTRPQCTKCGVQMPHPTGLLNRAHVIDRGKGGLDTLANYRPLCVICHSVQPNFHPEEESEALAWFNDSSDLIAHRARNAWRNQTNPDEVSWNPIELVTP